MGAWQGPLVQDLLGRWATTHSTVSPSCDLKVMDGMGGGGGGSWRNMQHILPPPSDLVN